MRMYIHIYLYTHTYIHTYIYIHTHRLAAQVISLGVEVVRRGGAWSGKCSTSRNQDTRLAPGPCFAKVLG